MNNRNIFALDVIDDHLTDRCFAEKFSVPQDEKIAALECGLHAATEDDNYRGWRVADNRDSFPHLFAYISTSTRLVQLPSRRHLDRAYHKGSGQYQPKVHELRGHLPRVLKAGQHVVVVDTLC